MISGWRVDKTEIDMDIHDQRMKGRQDIDIDIHDQGMKGRQNWNSPEQKN